MAAPRKDAIRALQRFLIDRGAQLPEFGPDGSWTDGGETDEAFRFIFAKYFDGDPHPAPTQPVPGADGTVEINGLTFSRRGLDQVIEFESGGRAYYEKRLASPVWPKKFSGVTIGIGYDLGHTAAAMIREDWEGRPSVDDPELDSLLECVGVKGSAAAPLARERAWIRITWEDAIQVYEERTVPRFATLTRRTFPGVERLDPRAQAMLLSTVFNRGTSLRKRPDDPRDRRKELRRIRELVPVADYRGIAAEIRKSKRLWSGQGVDGLLARRDLEAKIVEACAS